MSTHSCLRFTVLGYFAIGLMNTSLAVPEEVAVVGLQDNLNQTEPAYSFLENYITIAKRAESENLPHQIRDRTDNYQIGILQPDEEYGQNFYLVVENKKTLLFSKNIGGFVAYETAVPVYLIVGQSTGDIYGLYIKLGDSGQFLKLTVLRGRDGEERIIPPNRLLINAEGYPISQPNLFIQADIESPSHGLPAPVERLGPMCRLTFMPPIMSNQR